MTISKNLYTLKVDSRVILSKKQIVEPRLITFLLRKTQKISQAKQHKTWLETEEDQRSKFILTTRQYTERSVALHGKKHGSVILAAFEVTQKQGRKSATIGFAALLIMDVALDDGEAFFAELTSIWSEECSPDPQSPSYLLYRWICEEEHIFRPACDGTGGIDHKSV